MQLALLFAVRVRYDLRMKTLEGDAAISEVVDGQLFTLPNSVNICARGFDNADRATNIATLIGTCIRELSRQFDLSTLDGVTVAHDYNQALLDIDRGYETSFRLTPSESHVVGIAMTPSVIRNGVLKSHIVLNAVHVAALEDINHEFFGSSLHTIAHECAHVEITHAFDTAFPDTLLRTLHANARDSYRWATTLACWDEYAATKLSARIGTAPTGAYEDTFLVSLRDTRQQAIEYIKAFRIHRNIDQLLGEVYVAYGNLLKFAAYHLGNLSGLGCTVADMPKTRDALEGHWFQPYFNRLEGALRGIEKDYRKWGDKRAFEAVADLADELLAQNGIHYKSRSNGQLYIDIPLTAETTPSMAEVIRLTSK